MPEERKFIYRSRCLAVIGDKSVIPSIEPLTSSTDPKIKKDAEDAIFKLK